MTSNRPLDPPEEAARVLRLVAERDPNAMRDSVRLAAFLSDLMSHNPLQCRVLCAFVEYGQIDIVESTYISEQMSVVRAADNLEYETGLQPAVAAWAVNTWFCFHHGRLPQRETPVAKPTSPAHPLPTPVAQPVVVPNLVASRAAPAVARTGSGTKAAAVRADAQVWWCVCGMPNDNSRNLCRGCVTDSKPTGADNPRENRRGPTAVLSKDIWWCECEMSNNLNRSACRGCGKPRPAAAPRSAS